MLSFLSLPKPSLRSPFSLVSDKALFFCLFLVLSLLAARPAQAQYLGEQFPGGYLSATPCDAQGKILDPHPYPGYDGFYIMTGT